ncbi:CsbD family protein [Streptomyces sp. BA2]|uniref:CsbD family protein n=1 Tax=Streptomyces sp. BA2 TaxID=436595 RepID=UPI0013267B7A|nr:CsbD family protein [Streptomyces sp. BA2]MWA08251.1 CsbD family protein [Streptomyces sp. BA2]
MTTGNTFRNKVQALKGRITQRVGRGTGNRRLEREGRTDRVSGNLKQSGDKAKSAFRR